MSAKRRAAGPAVTRKPRKPGTTRRRLRRALKWFLIVAIVGTLLLAGGFVYLYQTTPIPNPNKDFQTQTSFVYYNDGKTQLGQYATQNRQIISYSDMPQQLKDAVVAAEDRTFWTNSGLDPKGIVRAAFNDARGGATQGASTITQQYVKILYLTQERSVSRKVHEAILSLKLQKQQSKQEILTGYLNTIYFGRGAYGVQAAAKAYFGVDADQLSLRQSAVLASVLNNPSQFDPANGRSNKAALLARYRYVLAGMASMNKVPDAQAARAEKRLPRFPVFKASSQYGGQKGHMLTLVRQELHRLGFTDDQIDGGGLRVTTTLTPAAMRAAEEGVKQVRPDISDRRLHVAAATVQPGTGALLGFFGGQNYLRSQINWAEAGGMVGSTFKPVSLAAAITDGYSLKSTWDGNSPYSFPDGLEVHNEGPSPGTSYGSAVSSVLALEQSINTAFVDMSDSMDKGPDKILSMANKMGIPPAEPDPHYPGMPSSTRDLEADALITLGKARISAINMANTYATIANGGQRADVHVIDKVTLSDGTVKYQYKPHTTQAIAPDVNADVSYAMQQVVLHGTGTNAQAVGRPAAGKTGTATNNLNQVSSSWFVGFTPQMSTAVMYVRGDGDNQLDGWLPPYNGAAGYFGAGYPTATWAAIMKLDLLGQPIEKFPPPANVPAKQTDHAPVPTFTPAAAHARHVPAAHLGADLERAHLERAHLERAHDAVVEPHRVPDVLPTGSVPLVQRDAHADAHTDAHTDAFAPSERTAVGEARDLVMTDSGRDDPEPVVHPTQDDPVAAALSRSLGGPIGDHAGRHPWWTPVRVVLAMVAVVCALGFVQKAPCYHTKWTNQQAQYSDLCYSDLPYLYVGRGFAELDWPYSDAISVRDRYEVMEYPVGIAYYAFGTAYLTHWLSGSPNIDSRGGFSQDQLSGDPQVRQETMLFVAVTAIGFALCALLAAWFLAGVHRRRPWDAALFAVSPVLLFEGLINWDLLAVVCVAGALWAHARGRPALTGVMLGLGTAMKLYPLFLLGALFIVWGRERRWRDLAVATLSGVGTWVVVNAPAFLTGRQEWNVFWTFNSHRGSDLGSVWLMIDQMAGVTSAVHTINVVSWVLFSCWCLGVAWLGFLAPETPRFAQLGFLLVVGFLLVNKVYSPQYALWLLPLAVMARPRLRDQLVWQGGELFYFCAVWWYLAHYLDPGGGGNAGFYWVAIIVRVVAQLYLVAIVVRDVIRPEYDVVRTARRRGDLSWWQLGGRGQLALGGSRTPDSVS